MSGNDYIKFLTEQVVSYMDAPKDKRLERKNKRKAQPQISGRWFGMVPLAIRLFMKKSG
ncbi:YqzE family protein [Virgibacillus sp. 179-BFC.A HS]|uniref:YqzE family protein n=1 Tax=Tigheibacillus jepli TaxID=3035914 RepID=A0ABU5CGX0_9BACI|nr:YqzE family protein [Virgibacillus sp. 179-BFC.A HS]MDY0405592.1 YqzE family protein [Virgibacillus sp. 179-BFC.A HS]